MRLRYLKTIGRLVGLISAALGLLVLLALGIGPRLGHYRAITVLTASMRPTMPEGSLMVQTRIQAADVTVGDVITYRIPVDDRRAVTHRVVDVVVPGRHPVVRTKGDANNAPDTWLARLEGAEVWKTRFALPMAGSAFEALRHPLAQRLSVLVVPAALALVWLRDIWSPKPSTQAAVPAAPRGASPRTSPPRLVHDHDRWSGLVSVALLAGVALVVGAHQPAQQRGRGARLRA